MNKRNSSEIQWSVYRRRRTISFVGGGIGFAIVVAAAKFGDAVHTDTRIAIAAILAIAVAAFLGTPYLKWPCPRCGKPFISKGPVAFGYRNHFARRCVHCKLPVGACPETGAAAETSREDGTI